MSTGKRRKGQNPRHRGWTAHPAVQYQLHRLGQGDPCLRQVSLLCFSRVRATGRQGLQAPGEKDPDRFTGAAR